jgi:hypothetical protein
VVPPRPLYHRVLQPRFVFPSQNAPPAAALLPPLLPVSLVHELVSVIGSLVVMLIDGHVTSCASVFRFRTLVFTL